MARGERVHDESMSRISSFIARMGETCTVHTRALAGVRDAPTQWPVPETWTDTEDVLIFVDEVQTREVDNMAGGRITEKRMKGYVGDSVIVSHMDRITYKGEIFEVESTPTPEYLYGNLQYTEVILVRMTA